MAGNAVPYNVYTCVYVGADGGGCKPTHTHTHPRTQHTHIHSWLTVEQPVLCSGLLTCLGSTPTSTPSSIQCAATHTHTYARTHTHTHSKMICGCMCLLLGEIRREVKTAGRAQSVSNRRHVTAQVFLHVSCDPLKSGT